MYRNGDLGMEAQEVGSKYSLGADEEAVSESVVLVLLLEEWIGYMRGGY